MVDTKSQGTPGLATIIDLAYQSAGVASYKNKNTNNQK